MGAVYATFFQDKSGAFGLEKCSEATHNSRVTAPIVRNESGAELRATFPRYLKF